MLTLVIFIACYNTALVRKYQHDLSGLAASFADIDSTLNERIPGRGKVEVLS